MSIQITNEAVTVDARPILAAGDEPFGIIMEAASQVAEGQTLVVWAPFEPVPLEGVLGEQGFDFEAEEVTPGNWRVCFFKA